MILPKLVRPTIESLIRNVQITNRLKLSSLLWPLVAISLIGCGTVLDNMDGEELQVEAEEIHFLSTTKNWEDVDSTVFEEVSQLGWIDDMMRDIVDYGAPGASILVIDEGEIRHMAAYGMADLENDIPVVVEDRFHFGSAGKQFTAMGIMMLAEEGLLTYDDPIGKIIPELEFLGEDVTIRRMLQHTSGIPDYDEDDELYDIMMEISDMPTSEDLVEAIAEAGEMQNEAGEVFSYSNAGYEVLGAVIERLSGQSYPDFFEERIFNPLGMEGSFSLPDPTKVTEAHIARSYTMEGGKIEWYDWDELDYLTGSGSFYTNLEDLARYEIALQSGALLSSQAMEVMFEPARLNSGETVPYGFGWDIGSFQGEDYVGHSGAWLAFESCYLRVPERNMAVIVLMNYDYAETDAETLAFDILGDLLE